MRRETEECFSALDQFFEEQWNHWVEQQQKENAKKNFQVFKSLQEERGKQFVKDLKRLMRKVKNSYALLYLADIPKGQRIKEHRFQTIPFVWVEQRSIDGMKQGTFSVQVADNKFVCFNYGIEEK